jgi:hypothetical protein
LSRRAFSELAGISERYVNRHAMIAGDQTSEAFKAAAPAVDALVRKPTVKVGLFCWMCVDSRPSPFLDPGGKPP